MTDLGIQYQRQDNIEVLVVDQQGNKFEDISTSTLSDVEWKLNAAGSVSLVMSSRDPGAASVLLGERELQIIFWDALKADDTPEMWWGHSITEEQAPGLVGFQFEEIQTLLQDRVIEIGDDLFGNINYADEEQINIAWRLISEAQTGPNMDLNIDRDGTKPPSGITRERHYIGDQYPIIYDELMAFPNLQNGFDWWINYDLAGGRRLWTPEYPKRGVVWPKETIKLEYGINLAGYNTKRDAKGITTRFHAGGPNDGAGTKLVQSYEDVAASVKYRARVRASNAGSQESSLEWLADQAANEVIRRKSPLVVASVVAIEDPYPLLGVVHPGDWVWVDIDDDYNQFHASMRILAMKWLASGGIAFAFGEM